MFPVSPFATVAFVLLYALAGALIGILSGWLTALALRSRHRLTVDSVLGAAGFLLGGIFAILMPWHANTISYELSGGTRVTSTTNSYQHPERVAAVVAVILPLIYEIWRRRRQVDERFS
jgi:H+/Cl- antiporter ClcA